MIRFIDEFAVTINEVSKYWYSFDIKFEMKEDNLII